MHVILSNILNKKFNSNSIQCRISSLAQLPCAQNFPELSLYSVEPLTLLLFLDFLKF